MMQTLVFLSLLVSTLGVKLPPIFQKCNRSQPDYQACVVKAATDGISQFEKPFSYFKVPNINPLEITEITMPGSGTVAVEQKFKNCHLFGLTKAQFSDFNFDFEKKTFHLDVYFEQIVKKCDYELDGRVLLLPIKGKGKSTITLDKLKAIATYDFVETKKNKKSFIKLTGGNLKLSPGKITFNFENLFNGDKKLGDNINAVLTENGKQVFDDIGNNYEELLNNILKNIVNVFFSKVSVEEAFD